MSKTISTLLCAYLDLLYYVIRITFAVEDKARDGDKITFGELLLLTILAIVSLVMITWWLVPLRVVLSAFSFEYRS